MYILKNVSNPVSDRLSKMFIKRNLVKTDSFVTYCVKIKTIGWHWKTLYLEDRRLGNIGFYCVLFILHFVSLCVMYGDINCDTIWENPPHGENLTF